MPSPFSINYCNRYNAPNWWLFNYNHSHPFDIKNCFKCMTKIYRCYICPYSKSFAARFQSLSGQPDHGHGSATWPEPRATTSSVWCISLMRAGFIDFPKCSCVIWKSLLILPLLLELVAFFIEKLVLYKVTNF